MDGSATSPKLSVQAMTRKSAFVHVGGRGSLGSDIFTVLESLSDFLDKDMLLFQANNNHRLFAQKPGVTNVLGELPRVLASPDGPDRLYLSDQHFLATPESLIKDGYLYGNAKERLSMLCAPFDGHALTIILQVSSIAQLASFVRNKTFHDRLFAMDHEALLDFSWADMVRHIKKIRPETQVWVKADLSVPKHLVEMCHGICGLEAITTPFLDKVFAYPLLTPKGQKELQSRGPERLTAEQTTAYIRRFGQTCPFDERIATFQDARLLEEVLQAYQEDVSALRNIADRVYV